MHSNMKEENTFKKNISLILINVVIFFLLLGPELFSSYVKIE